MRRQNLLLALVVSAVVVALLFSFLRGKPETAIEQAAPVDPNVVELSLDAQANIGVTLAEVRERTLRRVLATTGIVSHDQSRVAHIFPLARGVIEKVHVQLGDRVRRGQPLVTYDNIELGELIGEYLNLLGGLKRFRARSEVAKKYLDRAAALIEVEAIAKKEYELREAEYQQAVAEIESQEAQLARVEEKLHRFGLSDENIKSLAGSEHGIHRTASHNVLPAPFSGVITKYNVAQGELVGRENELFTLVDTSTVWVLGDVYEKDIGTVSAVGECQVSVPSYPDEVFTGTITYVSDFLDPESRTAKVRCVVPNPDRRLKLEMFATVEIPAIAGRTALAVPVSAPQQMNGNTVVFVQRDPMHFEKRVVRLGERGGEWAEVLVGLQKGERVVTAGSFYLKSVLLRELIGGEE